MQKKSRQDIRSENQNEILCKNLVQGNANTRCKTAKTNFMCKITRYNYHHSKLKSNDRRRKLPPIWQKFGTFCVKIEVGNRKHFNLKKTGFRVLSFHFIFLWDGQKNVIQKFVWSASNYTRACKRMYKQTILRMRFGHRHNFF